MGSWHYGADQFWLIAAMLGIIGAASLVVGLVKRALLPREEKFGLDLASRSRRRSSYEGALDGVRVRLDYRGDWSAVWEGDCASDAELFAHKPMAAFDRPLRSLLGPLRRLETPGAYGQSWAFYGAPAAAASRLASRLPGPGAVSPWDRIELRGGRLEAELESDEEMSRERLQEQSAAFRELLAAVRG